MADLHLSSLYNLANLMQILGNGFMAATAVPDNNVAQNSPNNPGFPAQEMTPAIFFHILNINRSAFFDPSRIDARDTRLVDGVIEPDTFDKDLEMIFAYHHPVTVEVRVFEDTNASYANPRRKATGILTDLSAWIQKPGLVELHQTGIEIKDITDEQPLPLGEPFTPPTDRDVVPGWTFDLVFNVQERFTQIVRDVRTIELTKTVKDVDGTVRKTETFTVSKPSS